MSFLRTVAPLTALGLFLVAPALAQDRQAVLDRLKAALAEQGTTIEWQGTGTFDNADGEEVLALNGVTVTMADASTGLGDIHLVDIGQDGDDFTIGRIEMPSHTFSEDGMQGSFADFALEGVVLMPQGTKNAFGTSIWYDTARLGELRVELEGEEVFTMTGAQVALDGSGDGPVSFEGGAEAFTVALDKVKDPATLAAARAMGYETLEGDIGMEGSWDPATGRLEIGAYDISVTDAGTLGLSFSIGGYTPDFIESLRKVQEQMAAGQDADNSAQGLAMLGLLQQLTFNSARIEFTDDSLTGKVLDYVAAQQGQTPQAIANQAKAVMPFMLMQLNNPELTQMVTAAVTAFLDDPQNLTIEAAPPAPVPFALIMAGAMTAPQALPQQLGVTVTANE